MSGEVRPPSDSQNAPEEVPKTPPESKEPKRLDTTDLNKEFSNPENKGSGAPQEKAAAENSERPGEDQGSISKSETSQPNRLDSSDLQSEFSTPESRGEVASQENKGLERRDTSGEEGGNAGKAETKDPNRLDTADLSREFTPPKTRGEVASQENTIGENRDTSRGERGNAVKGKTTEPNRLDNSDLSKDASSYKTKSEAASPADSNREFSNSDKKGGIDPNKKNELTPEERLEKPVEPYDRTKHYGHTPTESDREYIRNTYPEWDKKDFVVDHDPPLVKRYYEGDPRYHEEPGYKMSDADRRKSANDRRRMKPQEIAESHKQGAEMSKYSNEKTKQYGFR